MRDWPRGLRGKSQDLHQIEDSLLIEGFSLIAGVDEAGRGPLAGPVVAAAVILPEGVRFHGLKDSKQLTSLQRERFFHAICEGAVAVGTGAVGPQEIDAINILQASLKAMRMAVDALNVPPEYLLIDGPFPIEHHIEQRALKFGDELSASIAAASVIAKVTRDRQLCGLEREYPDFKFSQHKGYGTRQHMEELRRFGPTPAHRMTFRPVAEYSCHCERPTGAKQSR